MCDVWCWGGGVSLVRWYCDMCEPLWEERAGLTCLRHMFPWSCPQSPDVNINTTGVRIEIFVWTSLANMKYRIQITLTKLSLWTRLNCIQILALLKDNLTVRADGLLKGDVTGEEGFGLMGLQMGQKYYNKRSVSVPAMAREGEEYNTMLARSEGGDGAMTNEKWDFTLLSVLHREEHWGGSVHSLRED